jgi:transposase InsO family protein
MKERIVSFSIADPGLGPKRVASELRREKLARLGARHTRIHAGRPQTNGHVEALHKTILDEC